MDYTNISFTEVLGDIFYKNNSEIIEKLGYIKDEELSYVDLSNRVTAVYLDNRIKTVLVVMPGANIVNYVNKIEFFYIINIIGLVKFLKELSDIYKKCIEDIIQKYSEHNIIFFGHSLGGLIINLQLQNTNYNCYVYNPCFVNDKSSENIYNYRTNGDVLSLGLIGKETKTIDVDIIDYLVKCNYDIVKLFTDVHNTDIFKTYPDKNILIPIPVYKS